MNRDKVAWKSAVQPSPIMGYFITYLVAGLACYLAIRFFLIKGRSERCGLNQGWTWVGSGDLLLVILAVLLWPLAAFSSVLWWFLDNRQMQARHLEAEGKARSSGEESKYAKLNLDQLIAEQEKVMSQLPGNDEK